MHFYDYCGNIAGVFFLSPLQLFSKGFYLGKKYFSQQIIYFAL